MTAIPIVATSEKYDGLSPIDSRTPLAFLVGGLAGAFGVSRSAMALTVLAAEAGYAMVTEENGLFAEQSGDSYGNRIVDMVVGFGGYEIGQRMRNTTPDGAVLAGLGGVGMKAPARRSIGSLFGPDCQVDRTEFDRYARAVIYPGQWNRWLVAKNPTKGSGTIESFTAGALGPFSSLFSSPTSAIRPVASWDVFSQMIADEGSPAKIVTVSTALTKPPRMLINSNPDYYMVVFKAPKDAPADIAWPVEGCVEDAEWALTAIASPWTQVQVDTLVKVQASKMTPDVPSSADKTLEAGKIAASLSKLPAGTTTNTVTGSASLPRWAWWVGGAALLGGGYLAMRKQGSPVRRNAAVTKICSMCGKPARSWVVLRDGSYVHRSACPRRQP